MSHDADFGRIFIDQHMIGSERRVLLLAKMLGKNLKKSRQILLVFESLFGHIAPELLHLSLRLREEIPGFFIMVNEAIEIKLIL